MARARALSNSRLFSSLLDATAILMKRRGYSISSEAARRSLKVEEKLTISSFMSSKKVVGSDSESNVGSWVPDPITGYYRPANQVVEVDAAELREMLLGRRV